MINYVKGDKKPREMKWNQKPKDFGETELNGGNRYQTNARNMTNDNMAHSIDFWLM